MQSRIDFRRPARRLCAAALVASLAGGATAAAAQLGSPSPSAAERTPVPWAAGERLTYEVKFGFIKAGTATLHVAGVDTVRGRDAWHIDFRVKGGVPFYHVDDHYESWMDTRTLYSLRYFQDIDEGHYEKERQFEIYPERQQYVGARSHEHASVAEPLDDASFFYFLRTVPLTVGQTYTFNRYYKPEGNPVSIKVVKTERISVPAGTFDCVVLQPIIKTAKMFAEGEGQIWVTNDARRLIVQVKTKLSFGSINLYLKSATPGQ